MLNGISQLIFEQIPGCIGWKNIDLKYMGGNKNLLTQMNLTCLDEIVGLRDNELGVNAPKLNHFFYEHDRMALSGHSLEIIHDLGLLKDNKVFFLQKKPLRDNDDKITGVIFNCIPWTHTALIASLKKLDQGLKTESDSSNYYFIDVNHHNPANLSHRELECLFLQLRGKTAKQIAIILGLSKRTVDDYLNNVKSKLGCQNKAETLVSAIMHNYQHYIPKSLLNMNLTEILACD